MASTPPLLPDPDEPADAAYVGVALDMPVDRLFTYRARPEQRPHADLGRSSNRTGKGAGRSRRTIQAVACGALIQRRIRR